MTAQIPDTFISVAIVEDNRYMREAWVAAIETQDDLILAGQFGSCETAFESEEFAEADVVLMDIGLPGMNGISGVEVVRERFPEMAILMCTVHDENEYVFDALCAGAIGYMLKLTSTDQLVEAIREAKEGGSPMTPSIARKVISALQPPKFNQPDVEQLTPRECDILEALAYGKSYGNIADELNISINGVRFYIRKIYEKLQVHTSAAAVAKGIKNRMIRLK